MGQINVDNIYNAAGTGGPSTPNMPYVKAIYTGATYSAGSTALALTEITDVTNNFATNTFTAPTAGRYLVTNIFNIGVVTGSVTFVECTINVNGSALHRRFPAVDDAAATVVVNESSSAAIVLNLAASDTITFTISVTAGTSVVFDTTDYSYITITKIA